MLSDLAITCETGINVEQELIKDVFTFHLRNCDLQRILLSKTLSPVDALNQAIIDVTRANYNSSGKMYKNFKSVKNLNKVKLNPFMTFGNAFTKGHLNVVQQKKKCVIVQNTKEFFEYFVN